MVVPYVGDGAAMAPPHALDSLLGDPEHLLGHHPVKSAGAFSIPAYDFHKQWFALPPAPGRKVGHFGATRPGRTLPFVRKDIASFKLVTLANPTFVRTTAIVIPMENQKLRQPRARTSRTRSPRCRTTSSIARATA